MTSIFGNNASSGSRNLVEFKAGRMNLVDGTGGTPKMVHPDKRKGLLYVYSSDDGLIHFCWKDRTSGNVEEDLIVFPDDCEFKKVDQCKTGRVYLLKFKSSSRKLFFWLQEPETDKDDEWCRRINEVMNNPPSASSLGSSSGSGREGGDLQYMLNQMSQQQLMQLFGGVGQMGGLSSLLGSINRPSSGPRALTGPPTSTTTTTGSRANTPRTPSNANQPATPMAPKKSSGGSGETAATPTSTNAGSSETSKTLLSELQNYLAGINTGGTSKQNVDLATSLNTEAINTILSDPERLNALKAYLPSIESEEGKSAEPNMIKQQLKDTLSSPQFQQALSSFSSALQSGQLGLVVSQFKLNEEAVAAANNGDLEQFVKALEKTSIKSTSDDEEPVKPEKDNE